MNFPSDKDVQLVILQVNSHARNESCLWYESLQTKKTLPAACYCWNWFTFAPEAGVEKSQQNSVKGQNIFQ